MSSQGYRFGISRLPSSSTSLRQQVQEYERAGFDFVAIGDHVHGGESPFATLAAAAMASERLRLRTYVINTGCGRLRFWREKRPRSTSSVMAV
jgi:alkanesulfonate monooxygenase SsuD/methylene tetrahydromethanopterin reductase-like flavin-dependent oxidoreductase (luciferase family)